MRNFVIGCVVLFTMAGTAFSETKGPPKGLAVDLGGGVKLKMTLIPAGEFKMGSGESAEATAAFFNKTYGEDRVQQAEWFKGEHPQHQVQITKPFYLGKYAVTQEQWKAVMGDNPAKFEGASNPVELVSWRDCQVFLGKLNAKAGEKGGNFVLPTEAQWEYACRAGSTTRYCFGDDEKLLSKYAWYDGNSGDETHPAGKKGPNAWGLFDMHGNVGEWCQDWYASDYYRKSPLNDPQGPTTGTARVLRGGCYGDSPENCRSASRGYESPGLSLDYIGFRVCREIGSNRNRKEQECRNREEWGQEQLTRLRSSR